MKKQLILITIAIIGLFGCDASNNATSKKPTEKRVEASGEDFRIGFYNVENLFDIKDDPNKPDEEFTPDGKNKWTEERYNKKLDQLSKVISAMGNPTFLGVCEVENEQVLLDLAANKNISAGNYGVAHKESNDYRGIDVALMYDKNRFEVEKRKYHY